MCCLKNEEEAYEELNSNLPSVGEYVTTSDGLRGEVQSTSVLKQLVKVIVTMDNDEKEIREYKVSELKFKPRRKQERVQMDDELKALEQLERKDAKK
jgi:cell fate regulator YaaT (PSP1 superfamily)